MGGAIGLAARDRVHHWVEPGQNRAVLFDVFRQFGVEPCTIFRSDVLLERVLVRYTSNTKYSRGFVSRV
jgi:hypothetical protein